MKKILVLPSWYPVKGNELPGTFFREQALLMSAEFEFRVLYGIKTRTSILRLFYFLLFKRRAHVQLINPPEGTGFVYMNFKAPFLLRSIAPVSAWCEQLNYLLMVGRYIDEVKKLDWHPDIIHAHSVADAGIAANALSKKLSIPCLITEHQVFMPGNYQPLKRKLIIQALESANAVLAVSEHQKRQILMNAINCNPIVAGNYVNERIFSPGDNTETDASVFRILFVSYNSFIKDNETFFRTLLYLLESGIRNFKASIIDGNFSKADTKDFENPFFLLARKYHIEDYVSIHTHVKRDEMVNYYRQSDVLVSTSIAETFGVVPVEAMMCGIPVIATSNGGIDDYISDKNGLLTPIRDFRSLGLSIIRLIKKEITFSRTEIRDSVIHKYGSDAFSKRLKKIYNSVTENE